MKRSERCPNVTCKYGKKENEICDDPFIRRAAANVSKLFSELESMAKS